MIALGVMRKIDIERFNTMRNIIATAVLKDTAISKLEMPLVKLSTEIVLFGVDEENETVEEKIVDQENAIFILITPVQTKVYVLY